MKEFNLETALNGEPICASEQKCYVVREVTEFLDDKSVRKFAVIFPGSSAIAEIWSEDDFKDDIGMWEEPKLTSEQVLEKAYQENLPLDAIGKKAFVIAKTKDGDYVMQCGEDNLYFASNEIEWEFYKDPVPKSDTITVTLPKPFKPKDGESFYYINGGVIGFRSIFRDKYNFDMAAAKRGGCYRTREDAQKWLDFMKSMME